MRESYKTQVEFITAPFPKGSKAKLKAYAYKHGYKGVSEVIRAGVDKLIGKVKTEVKL